MLPFQQLYIENGVARTILLKPILQDFEIAKRKMVRRRPYSTGASWLWSAGDAVRVVVCRASAAGALLSLCVGCTAVVSSVLILTTDGRSVYAVPMLLTRYL